MGDKTRRLRKSCGFAVGTIPYPRNKTFRRHFPRSDLTPAKKATLNSGEAMFGNNDYGSVKVCGAGEPCAKACPFVRIGQPCIDFDRAVALTPTYAEPSDRHQLVA